MEISALFQDLINQIISEININNFRDINLGDLLNARVKAIDGDNVLLRIYGQDVPAKTLVPLEMGETITFQFQGMQEGKALFQLINQNLPQKELKFVARVLQSFDLPDTVTNREIINQMIRQQLPLDKKDIIQLGNLIKNLQLPTEDIKPALFLFRQEMPPTPANISLLKEFQSEGLNIFRGIAEIKSQVTISQTLPAATKDEITLLLSKLTLSEITPQDSSPVLITKLSQSPSFILNQAGEEQLTSVPAANNTPPPPVHTPEIIITGEQESSNQQKGPAEVQNKTETEVETSPTMPLNRENILNRLELLAGKSIGDHEKLNMFLKNMQATLHPPKAEILEMINKISARLDSAKPEEHAIKEILNNISNRFDFVDRLVQKAPIDNNQQIVFYSQVLLKDENNQQTPVSISIKQSKHQKGQKLNFDNCTLAISLQTANLSLVRANVKKLSRKLSCQLLVDNKKAKNILDPVLPELAKVLEKLNFNVTVKTVIMETPSSKAPLPVSPDPSATLYNIDIRI